MLPRGVVLSTLDGESLWTSVAQVFNQRGVGMVIRGGPAHQSKLDRQPHLSGPDSERLVQDAMHRYRKEHGNLPARLVVHKSSVFTPEEVAGFRAGIETLGITSTDLLSLRRSNTKLFRFGSYPPRRGTLWSLERERHILYTRGSVSFYETYPGCTSRGRSSSAPRPRADADGARGRATRADQDELEQHAVRSARPDHTARG